ncbi:sensor histidine kinase [Streptococcus merionis]|uniref:Signal transduction histidine kinase n=1 Tax=Streptococcus merionis TaxID=400065 RepID=A0A239SWT7_9STRE|nr:GHKL domain-containing protein [Streptococcus merionis]SNU89699.1 signal transduction histidine kinase [Streptococcus merionis]
MTIQDLFGFLSLITEYCLYLYVFSKIRSKRLSIKFILIYVVLEVISTLLLSGAVSVILIPIKLYFLSLKVLKENKNRAFFYSSYTFSFCFTFINFFDLLFQDFTPGKFWNRNFTIIWFITILLTFLVHEILFKFIKIDFSALLDNDHFIAEKIFKPINRTFKIAVLVIILVHILEIAVGRDTISQYTQSLVFSYTFLIISVLIFLNNRIVAYKEELMRREKAEQFRRLTLYTREVEEMYQTVRGFKHDYKNMLISLEDSIRGGDINDIRYLFHEILMRANVTLSEGENIDDLSFLENPALKSLLYHKIVAARQDGVDVTIEIKQPIEGVNMDLLDFVRLISVLVDNGVEAAKDSLTPKLTIAMLYEQKQHIIYVKNSKSAGLVPINRIFQKGYSTKGANRGTGLFSVKEIVDKYQKTSMETEQTEDSFTQVVFIGG